MAFERRTATLADYRSLLARFYGFHSIFEERAGAMAPEPVAFQHRRKTPLLLQDLEALGLEAEAIARLPRCAPLMPLSAPAAVMGSLYVVEGSTLGGAIIAKAVERRLSLNARHGCAYFRSYGRNTAAMWKAFGAALSAWASPETEDLVVESAQRTFATMHDWLCEAS